MSSRGDREGLDELARGFRRRTLVTAKLASRMGLAYVKKTLGASEGDDDVDRERAVKVATDLVRQFGALKGLVMKFGQMASYLPGALAPEAQRVLSQLQSASTAMSFARIAEAITTELGASPDALFDDFEREPFAAASIGQVHRATHQGSRVAVKVQYPGIEELIESDLSTVGLLAKLGTVGSAVSSTEITGELRARMLEECDYRREAAHQDLFRALIETDPACRVPRVVHDRTSRRVLTTELVSWAPFYGFLDTAAQAEKDRAAATLFRTCFRCVFGHCVFNADPHPGNYLFDGDGRVTFLDFGCVRWFEAAFIDRWKRLARSVVEGDKAHFRDFYVDCGFVKNPKKYDWDHQWDVMQYLYLPFLQKTPFTYTQEYVRESYDLLIFKNPNNARTAMPAEWLFLNRLQWGMNSILASLHATGPWGDLWREALLSPTTRAVLG